MQTEKRVKELKCPKCNKFDLVEFEYFECAPKIFLLIQDKTYNVMEGGRCVKFADVLQTEEVVNGNRKQIRERDYKLHGVIQHVGGDFGTYGHYTAYVKRQAQNDWFHFDDGHHKKVKLEEVLDAKDICLYMYERR